MLIDFLLKGYPDYNITIFSQGNMDDFRELENERVSFKLDHCIEETFHSLVLSKVLVMAKSSFSYAAAILNSNTIYYQKFWHAPLGHWNLM